MFLGFNSYDVYVPRNWEGRVAYSNILNLSLDFTSENSRLQDAYNNGYNQGFSAGESSASSSAYQAGYADGLAVSSNSSFYDLIDAAFYGFGKFIYSMFSFEILGVNMYGFIITIISVGIIAFILRLVL